jgi:hypothetical protein
MRPDRQPPDGLTVRLRLLPGSSRERICPTIDLDPVAPRPRLLQLQPAYPLAKVPPHQAFFAGLLWQRGASNIDDIMDLDNEDGSPRRQWPRQAERARALESTLRTLRARTWLRSRRPRSAGRPAGSCASARSETRQRRRMRAAIPIGAGAMDATQSTADVDRLAWRFNEWSTNWRISPPKRARRPAAGLCSSGCADTSDTRPSGDPAATVGASGAKPPEPAAERLGRRCGCS